MKRFVVLRATRWLPTGLLLPILILLLTDRGLTLGQIGIGFVAQGVMVFALELPTGGLADALGRRPVLLFATAVEVCSMLVLFVADTLGELVLLFALQGVYRALDSGPLDAWYVDAAQADNPKNDVTRGLSAGSTAIGLAIAAGALISGGLVAWHPFKTMSALALPVAVAAILRLVDLGFIATLMTEQTQQIGQPERTEQPEQAGLAGLSAVMSSMGAVPTVIRETLALIRTSRALTALLCVEVLWGFGLVAYETLVPPRLAEVVDGPEAAAVIIAPAVTVAWLTSAGFAAAVPALTNRVGHVPAAISMHVAQLLAIVGMAVVAGPAALIVFYLLTMGFHGALNPVYQALIHSHADASHRTTVVSAASMAAHPGGALGAVGLGFLADATSVSTAMIVGAAVLVGVVPLYLLAGSESSPSPTAA